MKTNVKLLKELLKIVYTKELLGKALFEQLDNYPLLREQCDVMENVATDYELSILERIGDKMLLKEKVIEQMLIVRNTATTLPLYRQSEIYFNENVLNVNLI